MKNYENMCIGMIVDKSEAVNNQEQIHLYPTPYHHESETTELTLRNMTFKPIGWTVKLKRWASRITGW